MRVLFLTNYYPPYEIGGYEQLCRDVAECLQERGHDVHVLTSREGAGEPLDDPLPVYRHLILQPAHDGRRSPAQEFWQTRRSVEAANRTLLRDCVERVRPDVVFVWNMQRLPRRLATDLEDMDGVAVAYWLAGYTPAEPDEFWTYWQARQRRLLWRLPATIALWQMRREGKPVRPVMNHVAVVSRFMRQQGIAGDTLPQHTEILYNGVELADFAAPPRPPGPPWRLLYAGRVSEDKGVHTAVEALGLLAQGGETAVELTIAGSGPDAYRQRLEQLCAHYHIGDRVKMTGFLPRSQMPTMMDQAHILLLPNIYPEAFARVVLEGMVAGCVVVSTLSGGTGEIVRHNETGVTFSADSAPELAEQLAALFAEPARYRRLAAAGQRVARADFSLAKMVDHVEAFLQRARDAL